MCRYACVRYKPHFACFACRKAFKRRLQHDVDRDGEPHPARCPDCGGPMAEMGLDFRPPPRQKLREWRVLETLWEVGETFHSCGCGGPGYRPREPRALVAYLRDLAARFHATRREWHDQADPRRAEQRREALELWSGRIARVEAALARLEG